MRLITGSNPITASQIVPWKILNDEDSNKEYFYRLAKHSLRNSVLVDSIPVYHSYLGKIKEHEFFSLDFENKRVLYYCMIAPSSERSIFKASLHPLTEKLVWKDIDLPTGFSQRAFYKAIFPKVNSYIISDEEQSNLGARFWYNLSKLAIEKYKYTVLLFGVDNKQDRRVYFMKSKDVEDHYYIEEVASYLHGEDIVFRHRGVLISKISNVIRDDIKNLTVCTSLEDFIKYKK